MNRLQLTLVTGAVSAVLTTLGMWAYNPNADLLRNLDLMQTRLNQSRAARNSAAIENVSSLIHQPIFVMTTGPAAYKEKTFQIFGLSITPKRKAVLLSVDGGEAHWLKLGDAEGDASLIDVGTNGASFDTPTGIKTVGLADITATDKTIASAGRGN